MGPRPLDREFLPDGIGCGDPFALAVARPANATDHRVDLVSSLFGVFEPLEKEDGRAFAHHETVGTLIVRPGSRRRQRPDLAELRVAWRAHVGVDAAGEHRVVVAVLEPRDRCAERCHRRCASGICREVRTVEVEDGSHTAGDDVRQLAGHRVLADVREVRSHPLHRLIDDRGFHVVRKRLKARCPVELPRELGEENAERGFVVLVPGHRVAEDHRRAVTIERALGIPVIQERLSSRHDRPLLGAVHRLGHLGRYWKLPLERLPVELPDPPSDFRIRLVRSFRVGIVIKRWIPSVDRRLADAVTPRGDVLPERLGVWRVREYGAYANDRYGSVCLVSHVRAPSLLRRARKARLPLCSYPRSTPLGLHRRSTAAHSFRAIGHLPRRRSPHRQPNAPRRPQRAVRPHGRRPEPSQRLWLRRTASVSSR